MIFGRNVSEITELFLKVPEEAFGDPLEEEDGDAEITINPTMPTFTSALKACETVGEWQSALTLLEKMEKMNVRKMF